MKIEVGKKYRVTHGEREGDVIKVVGLDNTLELTRYDYETIRARKKAYDWFVEGSTFSRWLEPIEEEKVVILRNGNTVTATQYMDGEKCGTGVAKCSPEDTFDFAFGAKLALERLFTESNGVAKTRFDWFAFGDGKISVQVNRETINDFLEYCEEKGFFWYGGKQATKMNPFANYDSLDKTGKALLRLLNCDPKENVWISVGEGKLCFKTDVPKSEIFVWAKPFDWESFKSGKIVVKLTKKNEKSFLETAEKNGCKCVAGEKPTEWVLGKEIFYLGCTGCGYGKFGWSSANRDGLEVVEW